MMNELDERTPEPLHAEVQYHRSRRTAQSVELGESAAEGEDTSGE